MSWRDTITDDAPANNSAPGGSSGSWKDTVKDDATPDTEPDTSLLHYMGEIPKGMEDRFLSYTLPAVRPIVKAMHPELADELDKMTGDEGLKVLQEAHTGIPQTNAEKAWRAGGAMGTDTLMSSLPISAFSAARVAAMAPADIAAINAARITGGNVAGQGLKSAITSPLRTAKTLMADTGGAGIVPETAVSKYITGVGSAPKMGVVQDFASAIPAGLATASLAQGGASPLAQAAGGISAGLAANVPFMAGRVINSFGHGAYNTLAPSAAARDVMNASKGALKDRLTPDVTTGIDEAERLKSSTPGFDYTLADVGALPGLKEHGGMRSFVNDQRSFESELSGKELDDKIKEKMDSVNAIKQRAGGLFSGGSGMPAVQSRAKEIVKGAEANRFAALDDVAGQRRGIAETLPGTDRYDSGSTIRDRYTTMKGQVSDQMTKLADDLGLGQTPIVGSQKLTQRFAALTSSPNRFENPAAVPKSVSDIRDKLQGIDQPLAKQMAEDPAEAVTHPAVPPLNFQDVKTIRERLGNDIRNEIGKSGGGDRQKLSYLVRAQKQVDQYLENDLPKDMPDIASKYQQFRDAYKDQYISRFERGNAYKVADSVTGDYLTPNEKIADVFFKKGDQTGAKQFNTTFGNDPEAHQAMRDSILDKVRQSTLNNNGEIDPVKYQRFMKDHDSVLDEFPEVKAELSDTGKAAQALQQRGQQMQQRTKQVNDSFMNTIANGDPDKVINTALGDPAKMRELRFASRENPDALRSSLWDRIQKEGGAAGPGEIPDGSKMLDFINKNQKTLKMVYTPDHINDLKDISLMYGMMKHVPIAQGQPMNLSTMKAIEQKMGMSYPSMMSQLRAYEQKRTSMFWTMFNFGRSALYQSGNRAAEGQLRGAFYNPSVAKNFANSMASGGKNVIASRRLNTYMAMTGAKALSNGQGNADEENQPPPEGQHEPLKMTITPQDKQQLPEVELPQTGATQ